MATQDVTMASEPIATYGTNSYVDVMNFLHTMSITPEVKEMVGRRLVLEVTEEHLAQAFARLDHLALLEDGWAGEGSCAVSKKVINNVKSVLLLSENDDWKDWLISPDVNATLTLQSKSSQAVISLGANEFSYYAEKSEKKYRASHLPFSPMAFLQTMFSLKSGCN